MLWVSAQCLSHSSIFFPCPVWSACSVHPCPNQLPGQQLEQQCELGRDSRRRWATAWWKAQHCQCVGQQPGCAHPPVPQRSAAGPLPYLSYGKDWARGCSGFHTTWPEKREQSFSLAGLRSLAGRAAQGMQWYEQRGKERWTAVERNDHQIVSKNLCSSGMFYFLIPWPLFFAVRNNFSIFFTVLPCQAKYLFSWKLIDRLLILIFVRAILEMLYFIISQLRTVVALCYKAANYSVSDLVCHACSAVCQSFWEFLKRK